MLEGIRAVQATWIGKALTAAVFALIVVAFVVWGIGDVFRGAGSNTVAQVGRATVSTAAYRQAYQSELQTLQRRARRAITHEEAHRAGLDAQVLTRLISDAVLDDQAGRMGLAISDAQVARAIVADPSFAGPGGGFDRARFNELLRENGFTEQAFVRDQRQGYLRQELVGALVGGIEAPKAMVAALDRARAETRSLDVVTVPASALGPLPAPDEAALQGYYDAHKPAFMAPQYRTVVALDASVPALAKPDAVPEGEVAAAYERDKAARFSAPERRAVTQVPFGTEAEAAAFAAKVGAGTAFADALRADGLEAKGADLGTVSRDQIFDPAVAAAAFALPADGTSGPVKGQFGIVVLHVGAIEPAGVKPLAEVAPVLRREIADRRAAEAMKRLRDKVEEARSSGKPLAEAAVAAGSQARTIEAVDAAGLGKDGQPVADVPDRAALLRAAFASDVGVDNDPLSTADGGTLWYEVTGVEPARQLSFAEAKPKVEAAWREEEAAKRLDARAADLVRAIDAGRETIEAVAAGLGLEVRHVADAKRAGATGLDAATVRRAFEVPVGAAGSAASGPASRVLFKVVDSQVPDVDPEAAETKQIASRANASLQDAVIGDYLGVVGTRLGATINQAVVQAATSGAGY